MFRTCAKIFLIGYRVMRLPAALTVVTSSAHSSVVAGLPELTS
jgi:hypothetical protein